MPENKFVVTVPSSTKLIKAISSDCEFAEYVISELKKELQKYFDEEDKKIDDEIMNGSGTETPTGLLKCQKSH